MRLEDIKDGDVLHIRKWGDMANEFGVNCYGNIDCEFTFTSDMKYLCGMEFTVEQIDNGYVCAEEDIFEGWNISADMLEMQKPIYDVDQSEFLAII